MCGRNLASHKDGPMVQSAIALKTHPCLVPYEDLPEVEKAYDRDTAVGTLKLICKLGFKITKE